MTNFNAMQIPSLVDKLVKFILQRDTDKVDYEFYCEMHKLFPVVKHISYNRKTKECRFIPYFGTPTTINIPKFREVWRNMEMSPVVDGDSSKEQWLLNKSSEPIRKEKDFLNTSTLQ